MKHTLRSNATLVRVGGAGSDGAITSAITAASIASVINTLDRNAATTFTPLTNGSTNIGTVPILPAFWGLCHPDVAYDVANLSGFVSVEKYAGQVATVMGEFGLYSTAGMSVRFVSSQDASIDTNSGGTTGSTGLRGATNVDLYTVLVYGMDAIGSVGLGQQHTDGIYRAGDEQGTIELILKEKGSGGTSDPMDEISTLAWKAWHAGAILNSDWVRGIRTGATSL